MFFHPLGGQRIAATTAVAAAAIVTLATAAAATSNAALATVTATAIAGNDNYSRTEQSSVGSVGGFAVFDADSSEMESANAYVPPLERPETYIVTVIFTLIFIVGVLGNGTLVIIFFRHRSMRNIPNTYILSLALADLLVIIVCVPLASIVYTQESWTFGKDMCRVSEFFKDISIGVSVFTLTALSGERYCAIVNPLRKLQTKPLTVFTAVIIWMIAILLATPSVVLSEVLTIHIVLNNHKNLSIMVCSPFGPNRTNLEIYTRYTVVSKSLIYYLLPLSIIGALYILMAKRLHISAREMPGETLGMQSRSQARARRHVARMVVAFVVVFFVCFFPYHLFELWFHLNPTAQEDFDHFWHTIRIIGFCTSFLHSCINPVTLYCVSGVFRQHFNRYLCCWCVKPLPHIRQHSMATGMMDTTVMSIRRSNTTNNYSRASLHTTNNNNNFNGPGGGAAGVGERRTGSGSGVGFHRQPSVSMHHNNGGSIAVGGGAGGGSAGCSAGGGGIVGTVGIARGGSVSTAQSLILSDKR